MTAPVHALPSAPLVVSQPHDRSEIEADRIADQVTRGHPVHGFAAGPPSDPSPPAGGAAAASLQVVPAGSGTPIPEPGRAQLQARFGHDFSGVRLHTDAAATAALDARAYTVGTHIVTGPGEYRPGTPDGDRLLAHELAHVVQHARSLTPSRGRVISRQQRSGQTTTASPASFADIPEAERKAMRVVTTPATLPADLPGLFAATPGPGVTVVTNALPVPVRLAAGIPASLQHGLANIAGHFTSLTTPPILTAGTTLTVAATLPGPPPAPTVLRFTWRRPAGSAAQEILVEQLPVAAASTAAPASLTAGTPFAVRLARFSITATGWSQTELPELAAALAQVPDADLARITGVVFARERNPPPPATPNPFGDEAGDYQPDQHRIRIFDRAFTGLGVNRYGGTLSETARAILHEIGHAVDFTPLRAAQAASATAQTAAQQALDATYGQYKQPDGSYSGFPLSQQRDFDRRMAAVTRAQQPPTGARSASGSRLDASGNRVTTLPRGEANDFRAAVARDGGVTATAYGSLNTEESFAEAYSLYRADPTQFAAMRPATAAYFRARFP